MCGVAATKSASLRSHTSMTSPSSGGSVSSPERRSSRGSRQEPGSAAVLTSFLVLIVGGWQFHLFCRSPAILLNRRIVFERSSTGCLRVGLHNLASLG